MSSLWGVEVHHLNCLSLHPWLGPGDARRGMALGPEGRVGTVNTVLYILPGINRMQQYSA